MGLGLGGGGRRQTVQAAFGRRGTFTGSSPNLGTTWAKDSIRTRFPSRIVHPGSHQMGP